MNKVATLISSWGYVLVILSCAALCAFFTYFPLTDCDIFWHLAAGREMVSQKHFLYSDPFSFTLASAEWIDLHWLFQLSVYGIYKLGSENALIVFKMALVAVVAVLLSTTVPQKRYGLFVAPITALVFYEFRYLLDVRPLLITLVCMVLYVNLLEYARRTGKTRVLWWCVSLQMLWANSQGLYMIGLFILGAYWFEGLIAYTFPLASPRVPSTSLRDLWTSPLVPERSRRDKQKITTITLVFVACILSCLVNPYGISGLLLPFKLLGRISPSVHNIYSMNISENIPLFALTGYESVYRTVVVCIAALSAVLMFVNRKNMRIAQVILCAGFLLLAISAMRNILLFVVIAIPIIGYNLATGAVHDRYQVLEKNAQKILFGFGVTMVCIVLSIAVYSHAKIIKTYPVHRAISPFRFPEKIALELKQNPIPGEMFNDLRYGGYLLWKLYPEKKVFIDTRLIIRSPQFFADYLRLCNEPELFPDVAEKYNVTQIILPTAIFPLYVKLIKYLYQSKEWHVHATDGSSILFVKNSCLAGPRIDLSDTNDVKTIIGEINDQWGKSDFVYREALKYFYELVKYLGLGESAEFVRTKAHLKEY